MGNALTNYVAYSRNRKTDAYDTDPIFSVENTSDDEAMSYFKREVHAFALQKTQHYMGTKAIYLYRNGWRVARAELFPDSIQVNLYRAYYFNVWENTTAKLAPGKWPLYERLFEATLKRESTVGNCVTYTRK